jgi:hypothetical protein
MITIGIEGGGGHERSNKSVHEINN